jgi:hypothetical protein
MWVMNQALTVGLAFPAGQAATPARPLHPSMAGSQGRRAHWAGARWCIWTTAWCDCLMLEQHRRPCSSSTTAPARAAPRRLLCVARGWPPNHAAGQPRPLLGGLLRARALHASTFLQQGASPPRACCAVGVDRCCADSKSFDRVSWSASTLKLALSSAPVLCGPHCWLSAAPCGPSTSC